ncbi:hypothetical protein Nepgr_001870 [Nepenthes gracilis]|uniref:Uncharacterized protein n=1 Tax=Nepenthes gracilis TaxID=150966 RepID=A0AAD3P5T4_NEPGR|nr:hypothetical protein Nepgr_001870 [Nepenthes gracilis]
MYQFLISHLDPQQSYKVKLALRNMVPIPSPVNVFHQILLQLQVQGSKNLAPTALHAFRILEPLLNTADPTFNFKKPMIILLAP